MKLNCIRPRRLAALALALLLAAALFACDDRSQPVYRAADGPTGTALTLSGCEAEELAAAPLLLLDGTSVQARVFRCAARPAVAIGAPAGQVEIEFAEPAEKDGYLAVERARPVADLDYLLTEQDGEQRYRLDTVYDYLFTVTGQDGAEYFIVLCGGREKYT